MSMQCVCNTHRESAVRFRSKKSLFFTALAGLIAVGVIVANENSATAQTILNSGFESPTLSFGASVNSPTGADWTFNNKSGISRYGALRRALDSSPEGRQHAFLEWNTGISQTISGFTVGQTYQVQWGQAFASASDSGGAALAVELSSPSDTQQVLPYTLANNAYWDDRHSDVFVARSESYTLSFLSDDVTPALNERGALIDDIKIVPVTAPAEARTRVEMDMDLLPGSRIDFEFSLDGTVLPGSLGEELQGRVSVDFDAISEVDVVGWHFNRQAIHLANDVIGQVDLGSFGTANVSVTDGSAILFNGEGLGKHMLYVDENGDFGVGSTFLEFSGEADIDLEGPIAAIIDDQLIDLSGIPADELGAQDFENGVFTYEPGHVDFDPTGNLNEYLVTLNMPWVTDVTLDDTLNLNVRITGNILAQGTVTFTVPEPSTNLLLFSGTAICLGMWRRKRARK